MPARLINAVEPVARAEIFEVVPSVASHIRQAAVAGAIIGAGASPATAYGLTKQYEAMGLIPRVGPETAALGAVYGPTIAQLEARAPVPGIMGVPGAVPGIAGAIPGITAGIPGITAGIPGITAGIPGIAGIPGVAGISPWAPGIAGLPQVAGIPGVTGISPWAPGVAGIPGISPMVSPLERALFGAAVPGIPGALGVPSPFMGMPGLEALGAPFMEGMAGLRLC